MVSERTTAVKHSCRPTNSSHVQKAQFSHAVDCARVCTLTDDAEESLLTPVLAPADRKEAESQNRRIMSERAHSAH